MVRRHDDDSDDGALSRKARPAWHVISLVITILGAGGAGVASAKAMARDEAKTVIQPFTETLNIHLASMTEKQLVMSAYVAEERDARCATARNVYLLCLAARVQCEPVSAQCGGR